MQEENNKKEKKQKLIYVVCGVAIGLLLASTITLSCFLANNKETTTTYTVFYSSDGENVTSKVINKGADVTDVPSIPDKPGYTGHWSNDGKNVQEDKVIYAIYEANEYNITFTLDKISIKGETPTTIWGGDSIDIELECEKAYMYPNAISVTGASYTWNAKYGLLRLYEPTDGVSVTINGEIEAQKVVAHELFENENSYIQIGNNDKIYFDSSTYINTTILPGDQIILYSDTPSCLYISKTNVFTLEEESVYSSSDNEHTPSEEIFAEFGYTYYLEISWPWS